MAVYRIGKILKEYNIKLEDAVVELKKAGFEEKITANSKLSQKQRDLLISVFKEKETTSKEQLNKEKRTQIHPTPTQEDLKQWQKEEEEKIKKEVIQSIKEKEEEIKKESIKSFKEYQKEEQQSILKEVSGKKEDISKQSTEKQTNRREYEKPIFKLNDVIKELGTDFKTVAGFLRIPLGFNKITPNSLLSLNDVSSVYKFINYGFQSFENDESNTDTKSEPSNTTLIEAVEALKTGLLRAFIQLRDLGFEDEFVPNTTLTVEQLEALNAYYDKPLPIVKEDTQRKHFYPVGSVGFNNFRRFEKLNALDLGGINLFVGQNNSGKSTVVNAMQLLNQHLQRANLRAFHLIDDKNTINVVTFDRALNRNTSEKNIKFHYGIKDYIVTIEVTGNDFDSILKVTELSVKCNSFHLQVKFNGNIGNVSLSQYSESLKNQKPKDDNIELEKILTTSIDNYESEIFALDDDFVNKKKEKESLKSFQIAFRKISLDNYNLLTNTRLQLKKFLKGKGKIDLFKNIIKEFEYYWSNFNEIIFGGSTSKKLKTIKNWIDFLDNLKSSLNYEFSPHISTFQDLEFSFYNSELNDNDEYRFNEEKRINEYDSLIKNIENLIDLTSELKLVLSQIESLQDNINSTSLKLRLFDEKNQLIKQLNSIRKLNQAESRTQDTVQLNYEIDFGKFNRIDFNQIANSIVSYNEKSRLESKKKQGAELIKKNYLHNSQGRFLEDIENLSDIIESAVVYNIDSHDNSQSSLLLIKDKDNPLAQAVHEYYQLKIDSDEGHPIKSFINKWLGEEGFGIGSSLKVEPIGGEAYTVKIKEGNNWMHLADKGLGSMQVILIILKIAAIIEKARLKNMRLNSVILIEEPEMNLHPALQSKLADLFYEVQKEYNLQLIVETHSEYLIRQSQVIVKQQTEKQGKDFVNPFKTIYFPKETDRQPYDMEYRPDGKFVNEFGSGFFDVSSDQAFNIL